MNTNIKHTEIRAILIQSPTGQWVCFHKMDDGEKLLGGAWFPIKEFYFFQEVKAILIQNKITDQVIEIKQLQSSGDEKNNSSEYVIVCAADDSKEAVKIITHVGQKVFLPSVYSNDSKNDIEAVILKIGRKYAYAVSINFYGTDDEKEMTFKIDLEKMRSDHVHPRDVYNSKEAYRTALAAKI